MIKVYGFSKVNPVARGHTRDLRVLWALEETQLPYEIAGMDHPAHDLNTDWYKQVNPFEQIPAIEDDGVAITESGAIVLYLARKSGLLMPRDLASEAQVTRWSFAALNSVEPPLLSLMVLDWMADGTCAKYREFLVNWIHLRFGHLEGWLANREFIATDEFTAADILMAHVLMSGLKDESLIAPYPSIIAYRDRCAARPAWKRTFAAYEARVQAG